jgi:hypothetical protein
MLKIKDNVDIKELEKFGFKPRYDQYTGELVEYFSINNKDARKLDLYGFPKAYKMTIKCIEQDIWEISGVIFGQHEQFDTEALYDLIKADLVEKV